MWVRRALNRRKRRFPARAVPIGAGIGDVLGRKFVLVVGKLMDLKVGPGCVGTSEIEVTNVLNLV